MNLKNKMALTKKTHLASPSSPSYNLKKKLPLCIFFGSGSIASIRSNRISFVPLLLSQSNSPRFSLSSAALRFTQFHARRNSVGRKSDGQTRRTNHRWNKRRNELRYLRAAWLKPVQETRFSFFLAFNRDAT